MLRSRSFRTAAAAATVLLALTACSSSDGDSGSGGQKELGFLHNKSIVFRVEKNSDT